MRNSFVEGDPTSDAGVDGAAAFVKGAGQPSSDLISQPVVWRLTRRTNLRNSGCPDDYVLQEVSTGVELGSWTKSPYTDDDTEWVFTSQIDKHKVVLHNNSLLVSTPVSDSFEFLDAMTLALRRGHADALVPVRRQSGLLERDVAEAASRRHVKDAVGHTGSRIRVTDALIFAALALRLAIQEQDVLSAATEDKADLPARRPSLTRRLTLHQTGHIFSVVFSSVKSIFVRA
jgi:hypothetical protein